MLGGDTLTIRLDEYERTQQVRYLGCDGNHYLLTPSSVDNELLMVKLTIWNAKARSVFLTLDAEASELRGTVAQERYTPIDVDSLKQETPTPTDDELDLERQYARPGTAGGHYHCNQWTTSPEVQFLTTTLPLLQLSVREFLERQVGQWEATFSQGLEEQFLDRQVQQIVRPVDQLPEQSSQQPAGDFLEQPIEEFVQQIVRPVDQLPEQSSQQPAGDFLEQPIEEFVRQADERYFEQTVEQLLRQFIDRREEQSDEQLINQTDDEVLVQTLEELLSQPAVEFWEQSAMRFIEQSVLDSLHERFEEYWRTTLEESIENSVEQSLERTVGEVLQAYEGQAGAIVLENLASDFIGETTILSMSLENYLSQSQWELLQRFWAQPVEQFVWERAEDFVLQAVKSRLRKSLDRPVGMSGGEFLRATVGQILAQTEGELLELPVKELLQEATGGDGEESMERFLLQPAGETPIPGLTGLMEQSLQALRINRSVDLPQGSSLAGWVAYDIAKTTELREIRWAAGDTIYLRFES